MIYTIFPPEKIQIEIDLPASKSISNRALILNALSKDGREKLQNLANCDDTSVMIKALLSKDELIDIGAAGTSMRFLTAYYSTRQGSRILTGTERMKNRPIKLLVDALKQLGAEIEYLDKEGYPPLRITGKNMTGGSIRLDGGVSSQYISALLMIAPEMQNGLKLELTGSIISKPYIHMTLKLMEEFGAKTEWKGNRITVAPGTYSSPDFRVESDWSAASYWYEITVLSKDPHIKLKGLFKNSVQGDSELTEIFYQLGISTRFSDNEVTLKKTFDHSRKFIYNFVNQPDLAQTFVVACTLMNIPFRMAGLQSLKIKETDRIAALIQEMKKLGYVLTETAGNMLEWNGEKCEAEESPVIATYEDHRMAMAFAPACLKLGKICINEPDVVTKSYPQFWDDLEKAGFIIEKE